MRVITLSLAFALPNSAAAPAKNTNQKREYGDEKAERGSVDRPGTVEGEPDKTGDTAQEEK
jgi:hypothetical protein